MIPWTEFYLGLIYQVYGLAFFALGAVAVVLPRRDNVLAIAPHLGWLAAFGLLHGLLEIVEGQRLIDSAPWLAWASGILLVTSYAALLELGRRAWNDALACPRLPVAAVYGLVTPAVVVLAVLATDPVAGLDAGMRYLAGAPGALLAGAAILAQLPRTPRGTLERSLAPWLVTLALALLAYGGLTLFLASGDPALPAWLPTHRDFVDLTGLPVQLARAACAITAAVAFTVLIRHASRLTRDALARAVQTLDGFIYQCRNDDYWTVTHLNGPVERLTGYPREAFLNGGTMNLRRLIHEDDVERVAAEVAAAVAAGEVYDLAYRIRTADGATRWVHERGFGLPADGQVQLLEGNISDDDKRRRAEAELRRTTQLLDGIVGNVPNMIVLKRASDLRFEFINAAGERLLGLDRHEFIGRTDYDFFPAEQADFFTAKDRQVLARAGVVDIPEEHIDTPAGTRILRTQKVALRDSDGSPRYLLAISEDVTERRRAELALRQSEARLKEAQRIAKVGSWELDIASGHLVWSDEIYRIFEQDRQRFPASYQGFLDTIHPDDRQWVARAYEDSLVNRTPYEIVHRLQLSDGSIKYVRETCESTFAEDGTPLRSVGTVQDITELHQAELELARHRDHLEELVAERTAALAAARDEAERANAAKSEFLSRMSHELRTPLNAVLGFAHLLQTDPEQPLTELQTDNVQEILRGGTHLLELVNEVLDLARIESGRLELSIEPVAVAPLVEGCAAQMKPLADPRGITMRLDLGDDPGMEADQTRLKQVVLNLLSNAIKYNREGGDIEVSCGPGAGGRLRLAVRDSGKGIAAEDLERVFRPFERLESAYSGIEGSGIGLALSKRLVEAMGGEIGVDSTPGHGSTFWLELPAARAPRAETAPAPATITPTGGGNGVRRILYVEDNPANLKLVQKIFAGRDDVRLISAGDAEAGLELVAQERPHLVLLDINLPGMNGFAAVKRLKADPLTRHMPVVAISSNAMPGDIRRATVAGFDDYLTKPLEVRRLNEVIDSLLGGVIVNGR